MTFTKNIKNMRFVMIFMFCNMYLTFFIFFVLWCKKK